MSIREHIQLMEIYRIVSEGILLEFDTESFLNKVRGIQALIDRGGTEGEKTAAREAMKRFDSRAEIETEYMSPQAKADFMRKYNTIKGGAGQSGAGMNRDQTGAWRKEAQEREQRQREREQREREAAELRRRREEEQARKDNAKAKGQPEDDDDEPVSPEFPRWKNIILFKFARYVDEENNNDKVYGVFFDSNDGEYYTCWGRHKGRLSTKQFDSRSEAEVIFSTKIKKGYKAVKVSEAVAAYVWNHLP